MSFHEIRFPSGISFGATGGPERKTEIVTLANGHEERNSPWAHSRRRFDAGFGMRSLDDLQEVIAFFEARMGQLYGFRWKDWSDWKSCAPSAEISATDQKIGVGDGVQTEFALRKTYVSGPHEYTRPIAKPVEGSVRVAVDGVETPVTVESSTGLIQFATAPGAGTEIRAGYAFDVPVRFDTDHIATTVAGFTHGEIPSVPVIEVRV